MFSNDKAQMISAELALPGRDVAVVISDKHAISGEAIKPPFGADLHTAVFGLGCFWGAERRFWQQPGVVSTAVAYAGGFTPNPSYEEVCSAQTGHAEVVLVVYKPDQLSYEDLLKVFWESHNPTQGLRQGNDVGSQYRSAIYAQTQPQLVAAEASRGTYQAQLDAAGQGKITTEIEMAGSFYYAEDYHQQYLHKNPQGYCGIAGTGVSCPIGLAD